MLRLIRGVLYLDVVRNPEAFGNGFATGLCLGFVLALLAAPYYCAR